MATDSDLRSRLVERFNDRLLHRTDYERFVSMIEEATGADRFLAEWLLWNETPYPFGQEDGDVSDAILVLSRVSIGPVSDHV